MTIATQARKSVKIAGKTYYYTQPDVHTYKFEFEDGRYIGQISYIRGTGREKDYWLPGTSGVHVPYWGEACALLLQEYWEGQAMQAAAPAPAPVVERAPEPETPKQKAPAAPSAPAEEWISLQETAARIGNWSEQSVRNRVIAGLFTARKVVHPGQSGYRYEVRWPGMDAARTIMAQRIPQPAPPAAPAPVQIAPTLHQNPRSTPEDIAEREKQILAYVQEHGRITRQECVDVLHMTEDQATKRLSALYRAGHFRRVRGGMAGRGVVYMPAPENVLTFEPLPTPNTNGYHPEPPPALATPEPEAPPVPVHTLEAGLQHQIEQLHAARVEDARTIGRLTLQVELLEQRLAECQAPKPQPRKWWQP